MTQMISLENAIKAAELDEKREQLDHVRRQIAEDGSLDVETTLEEGFNFDREDAPGVFEAIDAYFASEIARIEAQMRELGVDPTDTEAEAAA